MATREPKLLREILPHFASELALLLAEIGERKLVPQVSGLRVLRRCQCGGSGCSSFDTADPPEDWRESETIALEWAEKGQLSIVTHDGVITSVVVQDREDVMQLLGKHLPKKEKPRGPKGPARKRRKA